MDNVLFPLSLYLTCKLIFKLRINEVIQRAVYNCWLESKFQTGTLLLYAVFCGICILVRFSHSKVGITYFTSMKCSKLNSEQCFHITSGPFQELVKHSREIWELRLRTTASSLRRVEENSTGGRCIKWQIILWYSYYQQSHPINEYSMSWLFCVHLSTKLSQQGTPRHTPGPATHSWWQLRFNSIQLT